MQQNVGKIIYSEGYGIGGIYSAGYKELSTYLPLIEWLKKYGKNINFIEIEETL